MPACLALCLLGGSRLFNSNASANQVLLLYDAGNFFGTSLYQTALDNRGYPYQLFTDGFSFSQAVQAADPASDVVVVNSLGLPYDLSSVSAFVQAGGRALLQYWNLAGDNSLATTFQVSVGQALSWPEFVYDWGGSELYHGIGKVLTPFPLDIVTLHGQRLQPIAGGQAVAGFVPSPSANEAALVIGNAGRTIVQGFFIKEIELSDEALQFAQKELDFLFGPVAPPSGPWIISNPQPQTILAGFSTTLRVQVGGSLPLSYQWQNDGTNIVGATNATYNISDAQPEQSGPYSVNVSNHLGTASSGAAILTVTNPALIADILLMVDDGRFSSPYEEALIALGLFHQKFTDPSPFNSAVAAADPANTLVILDGYASIWRYSELVPFVRAGGRALMQNWDLTAGTHLAEAFQVSVVQTNLSILDVRDWGGSRFFAGVVTPLNLGPLEPNPAVHGQKLQPLAGAQAVAGFVASPTPAEAALVIGNAGHTIVNGFILEEAVSSTEATQVAHNQILHFFPLQFESVTLSGSTFNLRWSAIPLQDYQVQFKASPAAPSWSNLGLPITAFDTTASATDRITGADQRVYRVMMLP